MMTTRFTSGAGYPIRAASSMFLGKLSSRVLPIVHPPSHFRGSDASHASNSGSGCRIILRVILKNGGPSPFLRQSKRLQAEHPRSRATWGGDKNSLLCCLLIASFRPFCLVCAISVPRSGVTPLA